MELPGHLTPGVAVQLHLT